MINDLSMSFYRYHICIKLCAVILNYRRRSEDKASRDPSHHREPSRAREPRHTPDRSQPRNLDPRRPSRDGDRDREREERLRARESRERDRLRNRSPSGR